MKGGEFPGNQNLTPLRPMPTAREAASENGRMPEYYVMRRDRGMPGTMVAYMPWKEYIANCKWFTQAECDVYGQEYVFFFKQKTAYEIGLGIPAEPLFRSVKSPTECQQSLFESHFASRQSLSDCPVAF